MSIKVNNQVVSSETKSLWMGEIEPWMEETAISALFSHIAKVVHAKIIKNKMTGLPAGYGFVEFESHEVAKKVLESLNGTQIPGYNKVYRLNWAVQSGNASKIMTPTIPAMGFPGASTTGDFSLYVGDLDPNVTDSILLDAFTRYYKSILSANVIVDPLTKKSKKYGFVKFGSFEESQRAMVEMNGKYILSRPVKLNVGFKKSALGQQAPYAGYGAGFSAYGQPTATPTYPSTAYPGYSQDPYKMGSQGYGGYNYGSTDPYSQSTGYPYGASGYQYPAAGGYGTPYGTTTGMNQYPPAAPYTYPSAGYSQPSNIPSYEPKSYMNTLPQPGPYSSSYGVSTSATASSGYQYSYDTQTHYSNPIASVSEVPIHSIQKEVKEIDIDFDEENIHTLYTSEETVDQNKSYFDELISVSGKISLL